jgi:hypothetical protein
MCRWPQKILHVADVHAGLLRVGLTHVKHFVTNRTAESIDSAWRELTSVAFADEFSSRGAQFVSTQLQFVET